MFTQLILAGDSLMSIFPAIIVQTNLCLYLMMEVWLYIHGVRWIERSVSYQWVVNEPCRPWEVRANSWKSLQSNIDVQAPLLASILHASPCQPHPSVRTSVFSWHAFTLSLLSFHAFTFWLLFPPLFFSYFLLHTTQSRLCWISRA